MSFIVMPILCDLTKNRYHLFHNQKNSSITPDSSTTLTDLTIIKTSNSKPCKMEHIKDAPHNIKELSCSKRIILVSLQFEFFVCP